LDDAGIDKNLAKRARKAALRAYAQQHATELRKRAERRLGEMMAAQNFKSGNPQWGIQNPIERPVTLDEAGIDKNLAHRVRSAARAVTTPTTSITRPAASWPWPARCSGAPACMEARA
jgi:hypothetical protein